MFGLKVEVKIKVHTIGSNVVQKDSYILIPKPLQVLFRGKNGDCGLLWAIFYQKSGHNFFTFQFIKLIWT